MDDNEPNTRLWSPGYFGNVSTSTVDLSKLNLSDEERKILARMQEDYKMYKLYQHHEPEARNKEKLHVIRGLKYVFDEIQSTEDGYRQGLDWQALLY